MLIQSLVLLLPLAAGAQSFQAERDPPSPELKKQYRLILRTPGHICSDWRKVTPSVGKDDLIVSATKRDDEDKGCRFLWVITPAEPVGPTKFELEAFGGTATETFELAAPGTYQPPKPPEPNPATLSIEGIANENGTGPADVIHRGQLKLPGSLNLDGTKPQTGGK